MAEYVKHNQQEEKMDEVDDSKIMCCLCGVEILDDMGWSYGHCAQPLAQGRCCSVCNDTKVIPERMERFNNGGD